MVNIVVCNTAFYRCKLINSSMNYLDYYKLVFVFFKSIINHNAYNIDEFKFYFVTDNTPNDSFFKEKLNNINVNVIIRDYTYLPNFTNEYNDKPKWLNSFYKFDLFKFITSLDGISMFFDTDVMCINALDLNKLERDVNESPHILNMFDIVNNGKWVMGEVFIGNKFHWNEMFSKIDEIYKIAVLLNKEDLEIKFPLLDKNKPFFTNDETLLTIIFNENNFNNNKARKYIKRIWDANVENDEYEKQIKEISFIHIPQQKNTMLNIYKYCLI